MEGVNPVDTAAQILTLEIDSLAAGGEGVARDTEGRVVFVSGAAPGDRLRAGLTEVHRRYAKAQVVEVLIL